MLLRSISIPVPPITPSSPSSPGNHLIISSLQTAFQKVAFCPAKGHLLQRKRWPFALQKATFYNAKGRLLQAKRRPFVLPANCSGMSNHPNAPFNAQLLQLAYGVNQAAEVVRMHVANIADAERVGL